jgi:hypothetical protein
MVGGVEIKWDGFYKFCKKNSIWPQKTVE